MRRDEDIEEFLYEAMAGWDDPGSAEVEQLLDRVAEAELPLTDPGRGIAVVTTEWMAARRTATEFTEALASHLERQCADGARVLHEDLGIAVIAVDVELAATLRGECRIFDDGCAANPELAPHPWCPPCRAARLIGDEDA